MQIGRWQSLLVAGGAGFIGSCFVRQAVKLGYQVTVLDLLTYAGHAENLEGIEGPGSFELVTGNICDGKLVSRLLREKQIDALINFAAESHVDRSIENPSQFIQTNIVGVFNLLNASLDYWKTLPEARKVFYRHVQISTDEVYGSLGPEGRFSETTAMAPNSPYSASKASGDHLARAWFHTFGLPTIVTNCSNNYGPRQFPEKLIPFMIHLAVEGKPLPVYGDGKNIRDWIHVEDHCRGLLLALSKGSPGETYCFGGSAERANIDVVTTICRELDRLKPRKDGKKHESAITFVKDRLGHDRRYAIDDTRAQRELDFKREFDFESGLSETVRWYLANERWRKTVLEKARSRG